MTEGKTMTSNLNDIVETTVDSETGGCWSPIIGETASRLAEVFVEMGVLPDLQAANAVINEAKRILSSCNSPYEEMTPRTGLVCGRVQSGKTSSMTSISALARDNGFRTIILMAGTTNILVEQSRERLQNSLRRASKDHPWMMLSNPKLRTSSADIQTVTQEWKSPVYSEKDRRTLLVFVMKNATHLRNLAELFVQTEASEFPALIIDDEADQASLNTRPLDIAPSAVNAAISQLRGQFPRHTYLQYTATPQAPLLITRIDSLSADFAELVSPGFNYIGGEKFFFQNTAHVIDVPPADLFPDNAPPTDPPQSLLYALQLFFLGVAAGRIRGDSGHRSMLVHPSQRTMTHGLYYGWIDSIRAQWHTVLTTPDEPDSLDLIGSFQRAYEDLLRTEPTMPAFPLLSEKLPIAINQTSIVIVNSSDGREIEWENAYSHILVGGEKLGRGYTIKGLTVTYMPRGPGGWTADTIQQRARFFGYHAKYFGLCRVLLHPDVRVAYEAYLNHERDMRQRILEHRGKPLREWKRLFYLDHRLEPTRKNILTSPYNKPEFHSNWYWQRCPHLSRDEGAFNRSLLQNLERLNFTPFAGFTQHSYAIVPLEQVSQHILMEWAAFHEEDALGLCIMNCNIRSLLEHRPNAVCQLIKMNNLEPRLRSLQGNVIPTLFQGPSSAGSDRYPGDRLFFEQSMPTIQFHSLSLRIGAQSINKVPALAIHLPGMQDMLSHEEF